MSKQIKIGILMMLILILVAAYAYLSASNRESYENTNQMFKETDQQLTIDALTQ